jgi:hypothetical protein
MNHPFTERELATVLAALRYWQQGLSEHGGVIPVAEHFDSTVTPLAIEEIDDLCERLNCEAPVS